MVSFSSYLVYSFWTLNVFDAVCRTRNRFNDSALVCSAVRLTMDSKSESTLIGCRKPRDYL